MASSTRFARASRWGLIAAALLMGGALLATVWWTHRHVAAASELLEAGQGQVLQEAVRTHVARLDRVPTADDRLEIVDELAPDGVRYVAALDGRERVIAEAGKHSVGGERKRLVIRRALRRALRRGGAQPPVGRRAGSLVVEFEPEMAHSLETASRQTLAIGAVAAGAFLLLALVLVRWLLQRQMLERRLEHERRLASLGQMSAVLAHEIRNPLASLKGNAQLLARALPEGEKPRAKADRVVEEAIRLERLTNELLEFARTGAIQREPCDPAALLRDAAGDLPKGEVAVVVDAAGAPTSWRLDRERMRRVLGNLLDNARETGSAEVAARVGREGRRLLFAVRDRGPGLSDEDQARLFEPFYSRRADGTGLGLAVCKRIVDLHGGTITAANAPGGGAEFRILIPED